MGLSLKKNFYYCTLELISEKGLLYFNTPNNGSPFKLSRKNCNPMRDELNCIKNVLGIWVALLAIFWLRQL